MDPFSFKVNGNITEGKSNVLVANFMGGYFFIIMKTTQT